MNHRNFAFFRFRWLKVNVEIHVAFLSEDEQEKGTEKQKIKKHLKIK